MTNYKLEIVHDQPSPKNKKALVDGLLSHHASQGHPRKTDVYSIFMKDNNNQPVAGIIVSFLWNGMHIDSLWVDESKRRQGLGRKLMELAEQEAIKHGCTVAYTDTFTWQAPKFYQKLGYRQYGQLDNHPKGKTLFYYAKQLT